MKKAITMVIAMVLIVMITLVAAAGAFYWLTKIQGDMQAGTDEYQSEFTEHITGRISIVDFRYGSNTYNATVIMENSGSRNLKDIGHKEDSLIITSTDSSCDMPFNSSNCDVCPFDLEVNDIQELNINFSGTDCAGIKEGTEYNIYFISKSEQAQSSFIPTNL